MSGTCQPGFEEAQPGWRHRGPRAEPLPPSSFERDIFRYRSFLCPADDWEDDAPSSAVQGSGGESNW